MRPFRTRPVAFRSVSNSLKILTLATAILLGTGRTPALAAPEAIALDPNIMSLLTEVSEDSLFNVVQTLQDFHTRHTVSDTVSTTTGVGAARRWLHGRFGLLGTQNGNVTAGYFTWTREVCNLTRPNRNVLGTMTGSVHPERQIIIGGHLDSRNTGTCNVAGFAPGANDDGSGIALLTEVARLIPTLNIENTVIVQGFTGEEQGLLGGEAYATQAIADGDEIIAMINNDTVGNIDGCPGIPDCDDGPATDQDSLSVRVFTGEPANGSSRQLGRLAKLIGEAYADEMTVHLQPAIDRVGRGGDHIPFHDLGFPAMRFIETLEYTLEQHNAFDTIDKMEFSYLARNVRVNLALIANLAMAPPTPGGVQAFDLGTGGGVRVTWDPVLGEADLAGYRVAYRFASVGDTLYYADIFDAGTATSWDINGLTDEVEIEVSVSAYDAEGHESVFSAEKSVIPAVIPHAPPGFTAASRTDDILLSWSVAPELDLDRFRIYRESPQGSGFALLDSVVASENSYIDTGAAAATNYFYQLTSVDLDGQESPISGPDKGRLSVYESGILLVDATRDGNGGTANPQDNLVDDYYDLILDDAPILSIWDFPQELAAGTLLTDADMAQYQTVFIHSDLRNGEIGADSTEIRQYLENGGQVYLGGWGIRKSVTGVDYDGATFAPGHFIRDHLHVEAIRPSEVGENDFLRADPIDLSYPALNVDPVKWPLFGGHLLDMDAIVGGVQDEAAPILSYRSDIVPPGTNDGLPVGLKYPAVSPSLIFVDVPLYFILQSDAEAMVEQVLSEFGYGSAGVESNASRTKVVLSAPRPNPSSSGTELLFSLSQAERVDLEVHDVRGRRIRSLARDEALPAGSHARFWDGRDDGGHKVAAGIYFLRLQVGTRRYAQELTVLR